VNSTTSHFIGTISQETAAETGRSHALVLWVIGGMSRYTL